MVDFDQVLILGSKLALGYQVLSGLGPKRAKMVNFGPRIKNWSFLAILARIGLKVIVSRDFGRSWPTLVILARAKNGSF